MKLAVLPFNAIGEASAPLARQLANFCGEAVRASSTADINQVSFLSQVEQDGIPRAAMINLAEGLVERQMIEQLFQQSGVDSVMDGLLRKVGESGYSLQVRFHTADSETPVYDEVHDFTVLGFFPVVRTVMAEIAKRCEVEWPPTPREAAENVPEVGPDGPTFGTDSPQAFLNLLEGYDAVVYIQQAQGRVVKEFTPEPAIEILLSACKEDVDFEGPYQGLVALCRMCAANQLGSFQAVESALKELEQLRPDDFTAYFGLGEVYQSVGNAPRATDEYEKAALRHPSDSSLWIRLGISQMQSGMPINAERNFKKAFDLEGDDKPSADYIAMALAQTNRQHEIPILWKGIVEKNPQNGLNRSKYAMSLAQAGQEEAAVEAFETALAEVEDKNPIKRFFAPLLSKREEYDRAMDFYEDALDATPTDVPLLIEYAQTLQKADRQIDVPAVLQTVLSSNPDPNTRAQTLAWLIEIEQPKRVESVTNAQAKMQKEDFEGALRDLRPMRNWLADYWKFWATFAAALNHEKQHIEAEESARKLLELFPACVEGYAELASALSGQNRHEEAYQMLSFAARNMPNSLPLHLNLALAAKRSGHTDQARELAKRLREAVGSNAELDPVLAEIES